MIVALILFGALGFAAGAAIFYGKGRKTGFAEGKALIPRELMDLISEEQQAIAQEVITKWRNTIRKK